MTVKLQPKQHTETSDFVQFLTTLLLFGQVWLRLIQGKTCDRKIMEHMVTAGPKSLSPVLLVNGFAGMIFTIQTARELVKFGAVDTVGGAFALAFCRELAPILTASIIAEIGAMQVSEQIDALYMLRTDPINYLVVPRVIACGIMVPIATMFALVVGVLGGIFVGFQFYQITPEVFLESIREFLLPSDLLVVVTKSFLFGIIVAVNSCNWGLSTRGGVKQVGEAATAAVVTSWVAIFIIDFFISLLFFEKPIF
jgi:phospholipid/cholesterol/gamma-HCH transport system permease protein